LHYCHFEICKNVSNARVCGVEIIDLDTAHIVTFGFKRFDVGVRGVRGVLMGCV